MATSGRMRVSWVRIREGADAAPARERSIMRRPSLPQSGRSSPSSAAIAEEEGLERPDWGKLGRRMIDRSLAGAASAPSLIRTQLTLMRPLVAIGAPVASYYPDVAERLNTRLVIPPNAGVTNAVGA